MGISEESVFTRINISKMKSSNALGPAAPHVVVELGVLDVTIHSVVEGLIIIEDVEVAQSLAEPARLVRNTVRFTVVPSQVYNKYAGGRGSTGMGGTVGECKEETAHLRSINVPLKLESKAYFLSLSHASSER